MPALIGPIGSVVNMNQAVNGNAAGNPVYISQLNVAESATLGGVAALIASYNSQLASSASATLATTVLNNMFVTTAAGVPAANVTALTTALTQAFDAFPTAKGQVISNLTNLLGNLESDANWGPAARAFNNQAAANYTYSVNTANTNSGSPSAATSTYALTTNIDNLIGSPGNDTFTGINNATATQLNAGDTITGGAGTDSLILSLNAAWAGGATVTGVEILTVTQSAGGGFNASGITGLTNVNTNASAVNLGVTNLATAANIGVSNQDAALTVTYADAAVAGGSDAVTLTLNNVGQAAAAAIALNNTTATTGATGIETLTINAAGNSGTATGSFGTSISTNALSTLTTINLTGSGVNAFVLTGSANTTATTINGSTATGSIFIGGTSTGGLGTATHNVTLGSANDSVNFEGSLTSADTVNGGAGTDTIGSTAANWNTINTGAAVLANVTNFERLYINNDAAANATIDASYVGAADLRIATQTGTELVVVNNLGGPTGLSSNVRFDGSVGTSGLTLNLRDATLPGTANVVNLEVRGAAADATTTYTFTMEGVETLNVNSTNVAGTNGVLALTNGALTTFNLTNAGASTFDTGTLGANVSSVSLAGVTGTGTNTILMTAAANTGVNITGSLNADTITATNNVDVINSGAGNDLITGLLGADRINVGGGTDRVIYSASSQTYEGVVTSGTTVISGGADVITGMGASDVIQVFAGATITAATAISTSLIAAGTTNTVALVKGGYNSTTGIFTVSATGADTLAQWDNNGTNAGGTIESIVLVGFAGNGSATGTNIITLG